MRKLALLAVAVASIARLPPHAASAPRIADVPAGIERLLDARGRAWVAKDRDLLAGTLTEGPSASRQLEMLDNAAAIPFESYRFRVSTQFSGNLAWPRVRNRYPGREVVTYHVVEENRIAGIEREPFVEDGFYTFVRPGEPARSDPYDGWRLASTGDLDAIGAFSARHLWDRGPVSVASTEHFLLIAHPDLIDKVRPALDVSESAYDDVRRFWTRGVDRRYVIVAPSTTEELAYLLQATVDLSKFVAFAAASARRDDGWEPTGVRIYLQMSHFETYNERGQRVILAHELIHAVSRPVSGPFLPSWVEEGLAMYGSEGEQGVSGARRGDRPDEFPPDDEFFVGPTGGIVTVYRQSQAAVLTLVRRSGVDGLIRFYETLGSVRVAAGTTEYHVGEAIRTSVGWTVPEWTQAWRSQL